MNRLATAYSVIDAVRRETDACIVFCSLGKDSIVTLDMVYPKFNRVVCVFMYFVKGLEHIERWVRWVKARYPRVEFVQEPHWNLTYILRCGLYCVPNPNVKLFKLRDVVKAVQLRSGISYTFLGMKMADGMNRRLMLRGYKERCYINGSLAYPLAEWTQKDVLAYMKQHQLPDPVRYSLKAGGGVGFNEDCFLWMEKNFPQDLQKIYAVFPFSRRILYEYHLKEQQTKK